MRLSALILVVRERLSLSDRMLEIFIPSTNLSRFLYRNLDHRNSWFHRNLLDEEEKKRRIGERKEELQKSSTSTIVPKKRGEETKTDKEREQEREKEQKGKNSNYKGNRNRVSLSAYIRQIVCQTETGWWKQRFDEGYVPFWKLVGWNALAKYSN